MPRKPLEIGTYGKINTVQRGPKAHTAYARFRDADGRTRQVEASGASGEAARRALKVALKVRAKSAVSTITSETRVESLADFWLRTKVDPSALAVNTKKAYREAVEWHIAPKLGGRLLRECPVSVLDAWVREMAADKPAAARRVRTCLIGMFDVAVREDALPTNPARSVEAIPAASALDVRALSLVEVAQLRKDLAADKRAVGWSLHDLVDVMLATGCRIGEALALRWVDVDLVDGVVRITGTVVREKGVGLFRQDTTKGKKVRGHLVPGFAVKMLERRIREVPAGELGLVFPSARSGLREVSTVDKQWRSWREGSVWESITPHTFRKSVGTLLERQVDLAAAAAQLGHSKESITAKHYVATPDVGPDHREILEQWSS